MTPKYQLQKLDIPSDWTVWQNEFYDIDPQGNASAGDKFLFVYACEDLLQIGKEPYVLDLGWYGSDDLSDKHTGYCISLLKGNWLDGELLEKFCSKDKQTIADKIQEFIRAVDGNEYDNLTGYRVDENDPTNKNQMGDFDTYSVRETKK